MELLLFFAGLLIVWLLILLFLFWMKFRDNGDFKGHLRRNFKAEMNQGRIREQMYVDDHISNIADEVANLDLSYLAQGSQGIVGFGHEHLAGIVLAVTNMAEYYRVDIFEEIRLKTLKNEQQAKG